MARSNTYSLIRNSWTRVWLTMVVIACVINLSIDPPDPAPTENLAVNEIESIAEFVVEVIGEIENGVPEAEDNENEKIKININSFLLTQNIKVVSQTNYHLIIILVFQDFIEDTTKGLLTKINPPPKLV